MQTEWAHLQYPLQTANIGHCHLQGCETVTGMNILVGGLQRWAMAHRESMW